MVEPIIIGALGGLLYYLLPFFEMCNRPKESRPDFKDVFWFPFILIGPLLGGFVVYLHQQPNYPLSKWLSFQIGVSSPLILKQILQSLPIMPREVHLKDDNQ